MNKDKEVEVVDSREAEIDLMEKVADLIVLWRIKENLNGRVMKKARPNGKVIIVGINFLLPLVTTLSFSSYNSH